MSPFEFKIQKNHGTVVVHEPASGFLASPKWARGDAVPPEMLLSLQSKVSTEI